MSFLTKPKNEQGLMIACQKCDWKFGLTSEEGLKEANLYYRSHRCTNNNNAQQQINNSVLSQNLTGKQVAQKKDLFVEEIPVVPEEEEEVVEEEAEVSPQMISIDLTDLVVLLTDIKSELIKLNKKQDLKSKDSLKDAKEILRK